MFVIYLTVPLSARSPLSITPYANEAAPFSYSRCSAIHMPCPSDQSSGRLACNARVPMDDASSHYTITHARIHLPLLRPHVQIDRTNELEERIIIRLWFSFFQPLVPPDQQTHEDLDLLQREVEADAHPLASGETVSVC